MGFFFFWMRPEGMDGAGPKVERGGGAAGRCADFT